jgi:hypothetical protein
MMGVGGVLYGSAGADLWGFIDGDVDVATYLRDASASATTLLAAHTIWMVGVLILAIGGVLLTGRRQDSASTAARATYTIGAALAIPAFMSMVALTRLAESGADAPELANALAFLGGRLDDVATAVIIGLGPVLLTIANRSTWMPRWLVVAGVVCGVAGALSVVALFIGAADTLGFAIVPLGIGWMIAAGIVTIRRSSVDGVAVTRDAD